MRILSWLTDHFYVKMPPKGKDKIKKPKKGDTVVGISPLKRTVNSRRAAANSAKNEDNSETDTSTPIKVTPKKVKDKGGKKVVEKKQQSKKKLNLVSSAVLVNENTNEQVDNFNVLDTEASLLQFNSIHVPSPEKPPALESVEVITDGEPAKPARQAMFGFSDEEKSELFDWLEEMELQPVTNKEFHVNSQKWQDLLDKKASEYTHGKITCKGRQLYNMFKTSRKCYTTYTTLLNKSGQEAAHVLSQKHSALQKKIIGIYTRHAASTGSIPVSRPHNTLKSKVSISCFILNI